ncbi:MAG TPA: nuclear transport factor 2 family protein [Longimicrobiales bacterium]|nr:nuclear transport factor 2 family protein [Longimicrobiales bacterium]
MEHRRLPLALAALALVACGEPPADEETVAAGPAVSTDQIAIAALAEYWEDQYNLHNADSVAMVYTDSAWVAPADGGMFTGRDEIRGWLAGDFAASPAIDITPRNNIITGDYAVDLGSYSVTVHPEGADPVSFSGTYMNALEKIDGEWKIAGTMSNYDDAPPEGWAWNPASDEPAPPDNPVSPALVEAYEAAWNAGDAAGVAALYTADALVAFSNGPVLQGAAGVEASLAARIVPGATIDIHEVGSQDLGNGWTGHGGWYEITGAEGDVVQTGFWMNVTRLQDDGTRKIHWTLTNARPVDGM